MGRWLFRLLLTDHCSTLWVWTSHSCPRMDRPCCPRPLRFRDPGRLLLALADYKRNSPQIRPPHQQFPPATVTPAPASFCAGLSAGFWWEKRGSPVEGTGTFLVISPTGKPGSAPAPLATFPLLSLPEASFFCAKCLLKRVGARSPHGECWGTAMPWGSRWCQQAGPVYPLPAADPSRGPGLVASLRAQIAQGDLNLAQGWNRPACRLGC